MSDIELQPREVPPSSVIEASQKHDEPAPPTRQDEPQERQQEQSQEQPTYVKGTRLLFLTLGLVLSILLSALDFSIIATAIPAITTEFSSISNIAWYGSAYGITNGAFKLVWGKAYQAFPLKRVFVLTVLIFEVGNTICGAAQSSEALILGRVVAGLGGGGVMTGAFVMIAMSVRDEHRPAFMGVVSATFGIASVAGPLLGGGLTDSVGWRWCFWINLPIGFLAVIIVALSFRSPLQTPQEKPLLTRIIGLDLNGGILVTAFQTCFVLGMHYTSTHPWTSPSVWCGLLGAALSFLFFLTNEYAMGPHAMVHAYLLRKPKIALNLAFMFFFAGVFQPLQYTLPVQFQSVDAASASQSGVRLIPLLLGVSVFTASSNVFLTWWRHYKPLLIGGAVLATAGTISIYTVNEPTSTRRWIGFELLTGMGIGIALQIPMIYNQSLVSSRAEIPAVTPLSLFAENMGTTLFVAAGEAAFAQGLVRHVKAALPGLDPSVVVNAGALQVRRVFSGRELEVVLGGYLYGCRVSHLLAVSCGVVTCLVSLVGAGPGVVKEVRGRLGKIHVG